MAKTIYQKGKFWVQSERVKGMMDGESEEEKDLKMGWDKQEEIRLLHEVKQEVGSRDEARYIQYKKGFV